jgi:quinol monooxygenase YgiN
VAKKNYLQVRPIPVKFYVSEGWKAENAGDDDLNTQHQHYNRLAQVLLAGPYDTRGEAEHWNTHNASGHAIVWQF